MSTETGLRFQDALRQVNEGRLWSRPPMSASWLNLVERWFREITEKRVRRGVFKSVPDLVHAIIQYLETTNANPNPLVWTAPGKTILAKVYRANEVLETLH